MEDIRIMLGQVAHSFSPGSFPDVLAAYSRVFLLIAAGYIIHFLPEKVKEAYRGLFIRTHIVIKLVMILLIAVLLYQMRTAELMPFIYFRF